MIEYFLKQGEDFFANLITEIKSANIDVKAESCDHLCFRVLTATEYTFFKNELLKHAKLITEAEVKGRPICTFRLSPGFKYNNHTIELLELPFPKPNSEYPTGFEHAEFVIAESFDSFQKRHQSVSFKVAGNRNLNPELCFKLKSGAVKLHYSPLDRVIEVEEAHVTEFTIVDDLIHLKTTEPMKPIIGAALWKPSANFETLLSKGAELFFYDMNELDSYITRSKNL